MSPIKFQWDEAKNQANITKHGIDFDEAIQIFQSQILEKEDARRDYSETRMTAIGVVEGRVLYVVYTQRDAQYRIISARRANRYERRAYYQAQH